MTQNIKYTGKSKNTLITVVICLLISVFCAFLAHTPEKQQQADEFAEYDNGKVIEILSDNTFKDERADNGWRGEQMMTVEVTTGRYKGETLLAYNYVGPIYGSPVKQGESVTMIISTYADGTHKASIYEKDRRLPIIALLVIFALISVAIGGKTGAKSLLSLVYIGFNIFFVLLPGLLKGAPTIGTTLFICVLTAAFSLALNSGVEHKTVCAFAGTVCGMICAFLFAAIAQAVFKIDGLRMEEVEGLLQLRMQGYSIGLRGLLSASIIISSLGAVMDVTMGLASGITEVHEANQKLSFKELFASGMNIGKDMVGTMTSTLVLAFLGSSLVLILYLYSLSLGKYQLISSSFVSIELISSICSSIGVILSIPITNYITAWVYSRSKMK